MGLVQIIKGSPLFLELYDEEIDALIQSCKVQILEPGEYLFREGEEGKDLYIVLSGELSIIKRDLEVTRFTKGELLGELVLINDLARTTSCIAVGHSEILVIESQVILGTYTEQPRIFAILMMNIARMLAQRLKRTTTQLQEMAARLKSEPGA
jgi:CRP/FNR family cyclic AMP-dependent transcriptional regulator